jgi:hypothetical protein
VQRPAWARAGEWMLSDALVAPWPAVQEADKGGAVEAPRSGVRRRMANGMLQQGPLQRVPLQQRPLAVRPAAAHAASKDLLSEPARASIILPPSKWAREFERAESGGTVWSVRSASSGEVEESKESSVDGEDDESSDEEEEAARLWVEESGRRESAVVAPEVQLSLRPRSLSAAELQEAARFRERLIEARNKHNWRDIPLDLFVDTHVDDDAEEEEEEDEEDEERRRKHEDGFWDWLLAPCFAIF